MFYRAIRTLLRNVHSCTGLRVNQIGKFTYTVITLTPHYVLTDSRVNVFTLFVVLRYSTSTIRPRSPFTIQVNGRPWPTVIIEGVCTPSLPELLELKSAYLSPFRQLNVFIWFKVYREPSNPRTFPRRWMGVYMRKGHPQTLNMANTRPLQTPQPICVERLPYPA